MLHGVLLKSLRDVRRSFAWWSLGLVGYVVLIVGLWPTVRDNAALADLHETYPEALQAFFSFGGFDFTTPAGYLGAELFSLIVPLLLIVAAVGAGARAIAREEEHGTLELLLGNPISRRRLALEKVGALAIELAALAAVLFAMLAVATPIVDLDVSVGDLPRRRRARSCSPSRSGWSRSRSARPRAGVRLRSASARPPRWRRTSFTGWRRSLRRSPRSDGSRPGTTTPPAIHFARVSRSDTRSSSWPSPLQRQCWRSSR